MDFFLCLLLFSFLLDCRFLFVGNFVVSSWKIVSSSRINVSSSALVGFSSAMILFLLRSVVLGVFFLTCSTLRHK
jgi:hypothetical protein